MSFIKNTISNPQLIKCGVPQGSILGPLLFLIYINDTQRSSLLLKFILFADDSTLLFSGKSLPYIYSVFNKELYKVSEWIRANKLSLNISKTNTMVFQKNLAVNNSIQIMIDNNIIQQVTSNKFLGVTINSDLTWKNHINLVTTKIARAIGVIRRIRYRLSKKTAMMLYETLIVSHMVILSGPRHTKLIYKKYFYYRKER